MFSRTTTDKALALLTYNISSCGVREILYEVAEFVSQTFRTGSRPTQGCLFGMRTSDSDLYVYKTTFPQKGPSNLYRIVPRTLVSGVLLNLFPETVKRVPGLRF